jgi:hypothetical protein
MSELARRRVTANVVTVTAADATQKLRPLLASTSIVFLAGSPHAYVDAARTATAGTTLYLSYISEPGDIADLREAAPFAAWPGSRWVAASPSGGTNPVRASFLQGFTDRAGPPTSVAASAYDALSLLSSALEGGIDAVGVRDRLQSRTFAGAATTYRFTYSQHAGFSATDLTLLRYGGARLPPTVR